MLLFIHHLLLQEIMYGCSCKKFHSIYLSSGIFFPNILFWQRFLNSLLILKNCYVHCIDIILNDLDFFNIPLCSNTNLDNHSMLRFNLIQMQFLRKRIFILFFNHMLLMIRGKRLWLIKAIEDDKIIISEMNQSNHER